MSEEERDADTQDFLCQLWRSAFRICAVHAIKGTPPSSIPNLSFSRAQTIRLKHAGSLTKKTNKLWNVTLQHVIGTQNITTLDLTFFFFQHVPSRANRSLNALLKLQLVLQFGSALLFLPSHGGDIWLPRAAKSRRHVHSLVYNFVCASLLRGVQPFFNFKPENSCPAAGLGRNLGSVAPVWTWPLRQVLPFFFGVCS